MAAEITFVQGLVECAVASYARPDSPFDFAQDRQGRLSPPETALVGKMNRMGSFSTSSVHDRQSCWDERIRRAGELRERHPAAAEALEEARKLQGSAGSPRAG